jgi:hypothetical protein
MKTIQTILLITFIAIFSMVHAQKQISVNDVYDGKTVLDIARDHAVNAIIETKSIYKSGMTELEFVNQCLQAFPKTREYLSLRDAYIPYAKYLYAFHKRGFTDEQVRNSVTGKEYVACANGILAWQHANPGLEPVTSKWWKEAIHWAAEFLKWLDHIVNGTSL